MVERTGRGAGGVEQLEELRDEARDHQGHGDGGDGEDEDAKQHGGVHLDYLAFITHVDRPYPLPDAVFHVVMAVLELIPLDAVRQFAQCLCSPLVERGGVRPGKFQLNIANQKRNDVVIHFGFPHRFLHQRFQ